MRRAIRRAASLRLRRSLGIALAAPSRRLATTNGRDFRPCRSQARWDCRRARPGPGHCRSESRRVDRFRAEGCWGRYRDCRVRLPSHFSALWCQGLEGHRSIQDCAESPLPLKLQIRLVSRGHQPEIAIRVAPAKKSGKAGRTLGRLRIRDSPPVQRLALLRASPDWRRSLAGRDRSPPKKEHPANCPSRGHRLPRRSAKPRSAQRRGRSSPASEPCGVRDRRRTRGAHAQGAQGVEKPGRGPRPPSSLSSCELSQVDPSQEDGRRGFDTQTTWESPPN